MLRNSSFSNGPENTEAGNSNASEVLSILMRFRVKLYCNCNCNLFTHGVLRSSFKNMSVNYWSLKVLVFEVHGKPEYLEKNLLE